MNVHVESLPNCITALRIEVPADQVAQARERIVRGFVQFARIPGFRPGKAPRHLVEQKFRKAIREELEKKLVSDNIHHAIQEHKLRVLTLHSFEELDIQAGQPLLISVKLVTQPEFELPDYKNIQVQVAEPAVTEQDVQKSLEELQERHAEFPEITGRPLAMGDYAVIDYQGLIDGQPVDQVYPKAGKPLSHNTEFWIRLTDEAFFPGFAAQLVGANPGEQRCVQIEVPSDFPVEEARGAKIEYQVTIRSIRERKMPELDDAFADSLKPGTTLEQLRGLVRDDLLAEARTQTEREKRNQVIAWLISRVECDLPEGLLHYETRRLLRDIVLENQARGVSDEVLKENEQELVGAAAQGARDRLKARFILARIAEAENIRVSSQEILQRVQEMAWRYRISSDKLLKELEKREALGQVRDEVLATKVLDFLVATATVQPAQPA